MSRSYKKYTCYNIKCSKVRREDRKKMNRTRNRVLRNSKEVKNGGYYKKLKIMDDYYDDYRSKETLEETIIDYLNDGKSLEEAYSYWVRRYYFK